MEFAHIVVGSNVHGKRNGGDEHASHAGHAFPLVLHQCEKAVFTAKFILHFSEALGHARFNCPVAVIAHG